jgi:hypothetical protein
VVGVLRRAVLRGPEETTVELSAASMSEQGKREAGKSWLGRACKGKRGVRCGRRHVEAGENGARHPGSCAGVVETGVGRVVSSAVREQGSGWCAWAGRGSKELGRAQKNNADLDLKRISKLNTI